MENKGSMPGAIWQVIIELFWDILNMSDSYKGQDEVLAY